MAFVLYERTKCKAIVYKREQLRLVRGRGFRRHYTRKNCDRYAGQNGYCWQHEGQGNGNTNN